MAASWPKFHSVGIASTSRSGLAASSVRGAVRSSASMPSCSGASASGQIHRAPTDTPRRYSAANGSPRITSGSAPMLRNRSTVGPCVARSAALRTLAPIQAVARATNRFCR